MNRDHALIEHAITAVAMLYGFSYNVKTDELEDHTRINRPKHPMNALIRTALADGIGEVERLLRQ